MSGFRWKKRANRVRPQASLLETAVKRATASLDGPPRQTRPPAFIDDLLKYADTRPVTAQGIERYLTTSALARNLQGAS